MEDWIGKRIAITGGTGFVGRHMVDALLSLRAEIWALIRDEDLPRRANLFPVRGDLTAYDDVVRLIYESDPHLVVHLGAVAPVAQSLAAPFQAIRNNVMGTTHVLDACTRFGRVPVLVVSTDKAYGKPDILPVTESTPLHPEHPYDASKAAADVIAISYAKAYELPLIIARPANLFGAGDLQWSRLIPGCIKALLLDQPFVVRSDGMFTRDYLYVSDATRALLLLCQSLLGTSKPGEMICNISSGQGRLVKDVISAIQGIVGKTGDIRYEWSADSETHDLTVDSSLIRAEFGWEPQTGFADGLRYTVEWLADYFGFP